MDAFVFLPRRLTPTATRRAWAKPTLISPCPASRIARRYRCRSFAGGKSSWSTLPPGEVVVDRPCRSGIQRRKNGFDRGSSHSTGWHPQTCLGVLTFKIQSVQYVKSKVEKLLLKQRVEYDISHHFDSSRDKKY